MRETHIRQWTSWRCFLHVAPLIRMSRGEMQMARPVLCTWHLLRVETSKIRKFCSFWDWQNPQENTLHSQVEDILWWDSFRCNYDEYIVHSHVHIICDRLLWPFTVGRSFQMRFLKSLDGLKVENLGREGVSCWSHQWLTFGTLGSPKIISPQKNVLEVETWVNSIRWIYIFLGGFFGYFPKLSIGDGEMVITGHQMLLHRHLLTQDGWSQGPKMFLRYLPAS